MSRAPSPIPRTIREAPSVFAARRFGDLSTDALSRLPADYIARNLAKETKARKEVVVLIYSRYSNQLPSLTSDDRQLMSLYPSLQIIKPDRIIYVQEPSRSGADRTREGFRQIEAYMRVQEVTHVLFENVDRLARLQSLAHHMRELAEHCDVELWDPLGYLDQERFSREAQKAAQTRTMISQRAAGSRKQKVLQGLWPAAKPFGLVKNPEDASDVLKHKPAAQCVYDIFELAKGGASDTAIAREMTARRVLTPAQMRLEVSGRDPGPPKKWTGNMVRNILKEEKYAGRLSFGKTKTIHDFDDYNEVTLLPVPSTARRTLINKNFAIVTEATFDAVRASRVRDCEDREPRPRIERLMRNTFCRCGARFKWRPGGAGLRCPACRGTTLLELGLEAIAIGAFVLDNVTSAELRRVRKDEREYARAENVRRAKLSANLDERQQQLGAAAIQLSDPGRDLPPVIVDVARDRLRKQAATNAAAIAALPPWREERANHLEGLDSVKRALMPLVGGGCIRADTVAGRTVHKLFSSTFARFVVGDLGGGRLELKAELVDPRVRLRREVVLFTVEEMRSLAANECRRSDPMTEEAARSFHLPPEAWMAVDEHVTSIFDGEPCSRPAFEGLLFAMSCEVPLAKLPSLFPSEQCRLLQTRLDRARAWPGLQRVLEEAGSEFDEVALKKAVARSMKTKPFKKARCTRDRAPSEETLALRAAAELQIGDVRLRLLAVAEHLEGASLEAAAIVMGRTKQALHHWVEIYQEDKLEGLLPGSARKKGRIEGRVRRLIAEAIRDGRDPSDKSQKLTLSRLMAYCAGELDLVFRNEAAFRYAAAQAKLPSLRAARANARSCAPCRTSRNTN